jgi:hypothetical protein
MLGFDAAVDAFDYCCEELPENPCDCCEASATVERIERESVAYQQL